MRVGSGIPLAVISVAVRWTSQLPPRSWTVADPDPRGLPEAAALPARGTIDPRDLRLVFRALATRRNPSRPGRIPIRVPPLVALPAVSPSPFSPGASTPGADLAADHLRVEVSTPDVSFRPRGFAPPRRLPPHLGRGSVAPRSRPWGSSRFQQAKPGSPEGATEPLPPFPRRGSDPSKGSPRQQPYRITAALASSSLPLARPPDGLDRGSRDTRRGPGELMPTETMLRLAQGEPPRRLRSLGGVGTNPRSIGDHHPAALRAVRAPRCR